MKVAVLGQDGMLGHMVKRYLIEYTEWVIHGFGRESLELFPRTMDAMGTKLSTLLGFDYDYVINCIGAIKPTFDEAEEPTVPLYVNAIFPYQLARWGKLVGVSKDVDGRQRCRIIHITTDCVFDGTGGPYFEDDTHTATDLYGKSKSIGEPDNCMVIRTSIIGPEIGNKKKSLLEWVKAQDGKEINGYVNHLWNGITTLQFAKCIQKIIEEDWYKDELFHVYSNTIQKYELVSIITKAYDLNIKINEHVADTEIDRTLGTNKSLNSLLDIPTLDKQISEIANV